MELHKHLSSVQKKALHAKKNEDFCVVNQKLLYLQKQETLIFLIVSNSI